MENKPQNTPPVQPQQPAAVPVQQPQVAAKPAVAKPGVPLPKDQTKSNRKLLVGCLGAFGCSLFLFIGVLFAFLLFGSENNPIFSFLGGTPGEVVNVLITIVNLIFLVLVFIVFIFVVIGIFRIATARKDDKEARKKGAVFTFGSIAIMVFLIVVWVFAYFFLASKQTIAPKISIATTPEKTVDLTAPVSITFDAGKAPVSKTLYNVLSYNWDFGDKGSATGNPQTHTYYDIGNFTATVTIATKEKATGKEKDFTFTKDVTITNALPNVIIKASKMTGGKVTTQGAVTYNALTSIDSPQISGLAPLTIAFDATGTTAPNGEISEFSWDLNGDGTYSADENNSPVFGKAQWSYNDAGSYKVALKVTDSHNAVVQKNQTVTVVVQAPDVPTAVIRIEGVEDTKLQTATAYMFSGADSTTPTGTIQKYSWDFGDGAKADTRTASHVYKDAGTFNINLKVTSSTGNSGEAQQTYTVTTISAAPLVSLKTTPAAVDNIVNGQAPLNVIFDASGSKDANNDIIDYAWDFNGDGKADDANPTTSYTFGKAGTYNVSLTVTDASKLSTKAQVVVKVAPAGLKAQIQATPIDGTVPLTVRFDGSASSYAEGKIVSYEWDFGDGTAPHIDTAVVSHQYSAIGTFTVKVTAIASDNKKDTASMTINVRPVPVKACFDATVESGVAPLDVQFDPTCSTGTVIKYFWDFASLGSSTDRKPTFTFKDPGTYTVKLQVSDSQNIVDTFTKTITVKAP